MSRMNSGKILSSLLSHKNSIDYQTVPLFSGSRRYSFRIQTRGDSVEPHPGSSEDRHAFDCCLLTLEVAVGLPTLTAALLRSHSDPGGSKLADDHALFLFGDCAHELSHQVPDWVILKEVWFRDGDDRKPALLKLTDNRFLSHQVPCETIQALNQDAPNAVAVTVRWASWVHRTDTIEAESEGE